MSSTLDKLKIMTVAEGELEVALDQIARLVGVLRRSDPEWREANGGELVYDDEWDEVIAEAEEYLSEFKRPGYSSTNNQEITMSIKFGGCFYRSERVAAGAFLDWFLGVGSRHCNVDQSTTVESVTADLARDIADGHVARPDWLTDELIASELPAALEQARFNEDRADANLQEPD